jgi:KDO2-lipid IV(A) lauroyltransferase
MSDDVAGRARKPSLAHTAEYLALRGTVAALNTLPWQRAGKLGAGLGSLGFRPLGIRRAVVESQLRAAFPGLDDGEILRISRASYAHLGRTAIETALLPSLRQSEIIDLFEKVTGWEFVQDGIRAGRGVIGVTGHLGNWELGGAYIAARGVPVDAIVRHMANPRFDRYLNMTRASLGVRVVYDDQAVRQTPRALRDGRFVAFLADQGVLGLASTFVPFFGRLAKTPRGPAVFALRLDAPVVFGTAIRQPSGRYHMAFEPVEVTRSGDREQDTDDIVTRFTAILERWVRIAPEQYLWQHRRWRRQPPGAAATIESSSATPTEST